MADKPKRQKTVWQQWIAMVFMMLIGAACGVLIVIYMETTYTTGRTVGKELFILALLVIVMYAALYLQMVIHEAGHLVFGLLSGYQFSSFRIMSFMWVKENNSIKFRKLTIAGTGGQCLMVPPELEDGRIPVVLYNLGGSMMNLIASALFFGMWFLFPEIPFLSMLLLMLVVTGVILAIMNGVPMRLGTVDNDGYNTLSLRKNQEALYSFWVQMKVNEQIASGVRLKDMPDEWFTVPADYEMKNSMVAARGVFACNRMVDAHRFAEAEALIEHLLAIDSGLVGLHRRLMICDRIYLELIGQNRSEVLDKMYTREQKKFMKSMKNFPSVLRTEYVYALLAEKNQGKAESMVKVFEKCAKSYPYPSDIQSERELLEIVEAKL